MLKRTSVVALTLLFLFVFPLVASAAPVVFTVGSTTFLYSGGPATMDIARYIRDGRVSLPLRYVALAVGVSSEDIMWDAGSGTATLVSNDRVVQVKIGSRTMVVNGVQVAMDVAPELRSGRVMLPLRWIAAAFGLNVNWDAAT